MGQCWLRLEATLDQAGDEAFTLQQCSCREGVCCWQGWRVSPASWLVQQSCEVLLAFSCQSAPGGPHSHPCCSRHHHPLQQGKEGSSPVPSDHPHSSPQHHPFPQGLPRCSWQPFHPLVLETWCSPATFLQTTVLWMY